MRQPNPARQKIVEVFLKAIEPIARLLVKLGIHPHVVTTAGLLISLIAANFYRLGLFILAGLFLALAGICDVLDGCLARESDKVSKYGALIDSTIDRYSEVFIFLGLVAYYHQRSSYLVFVIILAIAGSMIVSYTRARAEGLGIQCKIGIMQRQERIVALLAGTVLATIPGIGNYIMIFTIWFIAVMTNITVIQRIIYVRKELKSLNNGLASNS